MHPLQLIADSGATKTSWCLTGNGHKPTRFSTQGINPYFFTGEQINNLLIKEKTAGLKEKDISSVNFYC